MKAEPEEESNERGELVLEGREKGKEGRRGEKKTKGMSGMSQRCLVLKAECKTEEDNERIQHLILLCL